MKGTNPSCRGQLLTSQAVQTCEKQRLHVERGQVGNRKAADYRCPGLFAFWTQQEERWNGSMKGLACAGLPQRRKRARTMNEGIIHTVNSLRALNLHRQVQISPWPGLCCVNELGRVTFLPTTMRILILSSDGACGTDGTDTHYARSAQPWEARGFVYSTIAAASNAVTCCHQWLHNLGI